MSEEQHFSVNKANWDNRAVLHASRDSGYQTQQFIDDRERLSNVVKFDLPRVGDIKDKRAVHLQCHIGTDTISLARLGATEVHGLDFSGEAIKAAKALAQETGDDVVFVEANVYDALSVLPSGHFDLVFTGIGALCWLIEKWAEVVSSLLAPGGCLLLREGHPILFSVDETLSNGPTLRFPYFNKARRSNGTMPTHTSRPIITALLNRGLVLELLEEHDTAPWEACPGMMVKRDLDEFALKEHDGCMPLTYTLIARKALGPIQVKHGASFSVPRKTA